MIYHNHCDRSPHAQGTPYHRALDLDDIRPNEARVHLVASGVCHKDACGSKAGSPVEKLTKQYSLQDINKAFEDSASGATVKPVIVF